MGLFIGDITPDKKIGFLLAALEVNWTGSSRTWWEPGSLEGLGKHLSGTQVSLLLLRRYV